MHNRPRITGGLPRAPAPQQPSPGRAYAYASVSTGRLPLRSSLTTPTPPALMGRLPLRSSLTTPTPPALMGRRPLRSSLTTRTPRYRLVGSRSVRPRAASLPIRLGVDGSAPAPFVPHYAYASGVDGSAPAPFVPHYAYASVSTGRLPLRSAAGGLTTHTPRC